MVMIKADIGVSLTMSEAENISFISKDYCIHKHLYKVFHRLSSVFLNSYLTGSFSLEQRFSKWASKPLQERSVNRSEKVK